MKVMQEAKVVKVQRKGYEVYKAVCPGWVYRERILVPGKCYTSKELIDTSEEITKKTLGLFENPIILLEYGIENEE